MQPEAHRCQKEIRLVTNVCNISLIFSPVHKEHSENERTDESTRTPTHTLLRCNCPQRKISRFFYVKSYKR